MLTSSACFNLGKSTPFPSFSETERHISRQARCAGHIVHFHYPTMFDQYSIVWSHSDCIALLIQVTVLHKTLTSEVVVFLGLKSYHYLSYKHPKVPEQLRRQNLFFCSNSAMIRVEFTILSYCTFPQSQVL